MKDEGRTCQPLASLFFVMAKPIGATCNLHCSYCYYLEKEALYAPAQQAVMNDQLLDQFIHDYIEAQTTSSVLFTWHGGEPLLLPLEFYEKVIRLQRKYAGGRAIDNVIQTNGTLIDDRWADFFHQEGWLVGVSIDGPRIMHDAYRRNVTGKGSFDRVMRGIDCLNRHQVEWNAMATVNHINGDHPETVYHFFKDIGCQYIQFTPVVERSMPHANGTRLASADEDGTITDYSVSAEQWGRFLCTIFDEWVRQDVGQTFVEIFDATLANWMGVTPGVCALAKTCGRALAMEWNGDVYLCDHFVFPAYRLGNIRERAFVEMMTDKRQQTFAYAKQAALPRQCRQCEWRFTCNGECPRNRFLTTSDGERGLNYLCAGYRAFFAHVAPYMDYMRQCLLNDDAPAMVMEAIRNGIL